MAKEILLYGTIDSISSSDFIREFNDIDENEGIEVRVNTPGGSPEYGFGMVSKFAEYKGDKKVKVDGKAHSMGLFYCVYAAKENVEALDVSEFLLHRAAYPDWVERDKEYFNDAMRTNLERINKSLRTAFENRVDVPLFEQLTGCKVKDVFSMESRLDVTFSAAVAKKIGLISKIIPITPAKSAEINTYLSAVVSKTYDIAAFNTISVEEKTIIKNSNQNKMTLEELKAQHPEVYAAAVAVGVSKENDRVKSIMVFNHLDPAGCKAAIESGKDLTATQMAEFSLKAMSPEALKAAAKTAPVDIQTNAEETQEKTAAEKKVTDFAAEVKANLGLVK